MIPRHEAKKEVLVQPSPRGNGSIEVDQQELVRPQKLPETPVPPIPDVDESNADSASVQYSHYRTKLSNHRTGLSEHRTSLSEHRTDLSRFRTKLSTQRTELSMRRTGMSFQRTRMSADRTLASVIRTALSLISFGFTIYQVFRKFLEPQHANIAPARNFGIALVGLGITMLIFGIIYHVYFMIGLRNERKSMSALGLVHAESAFPPSMMLISAVILLIIGITAIVSMIYHVGPFH